MVVRLAAYDIDSKRLRSSAAIALSLAPLDELLRHRGVNTDGDPGSIAGFALYRHDDRAVLDRS